MQEKDRGVVYMVLLYCSIVESATFMLYTVTSAIP